MSSCATAAQSPLPLAGEGGAKRRERGITGAILAGGASRRMGGQDKGLVEFRGRPLVAWVIEALAPQVDEIIIVANRNLDVYRGFGHRVVSDLRPDFPGPLAGFEAALTAARHDWILSCPTDSPLLPPDYASFFVPARRSASGGLLQAGSPESGATPVSPAVAIVEGHWEPLFSLLPKSALPALSAALDAGERKAQRWLATLAPVLVNLDARARQLRDADSPDDLLRLAKSFPGT